MAKKAAITKVLSCALVFVILMSVMPVSVFAVNDSNNSTGNASNRSNELVNAFIVNNSAEVMIPLFNNNITDNYRAWSEEDNRSGDCAPVPDADLPVIYLNDTQEGVLSSDSGNDTNIIILTDVSDGTRETVSALGCEVYVKIDDPCCVGYCVYVDGVYQFTEGQDGTPDGYCAFYVSAGTHTIKINKNGRSASKTNYFQCGNTYRWVSMPHCWCENDDHGDEVKFRGIVTEYSEGMTGGYWWDVKVDEWISGSMPCDIIRVRFGVIPDVPIGSYDLSIRIGDYVEAYGSVYPNECSVGLNGESYYIKKISSELLSINVWTDKSEYKIGETVTIYYKTNKKCTAKLTITKPDGGDVVYGPNEIPASTRSKSATAGYPTGKRTVVFEAWAGDEYKKATCYFDVVDEEECEVKFQGTVNSTYPEETYFSCEVRVDKILSDPDVCIEEGWIVDIVLGDSPCGSYEEVKKGDKIEVFGKRLPVWCWPPQISLCGKTSYYLKKIDSETLSISVWTDKSEYKIGETVTIYYKTNKKCTAKLTITKPDGGDVVYGPNEIPASTRSKSATAGYPTGKRTVVFEAWAGAEYKKATCYFDVVDEEECEVKFRGIVMDIRGTTPWVQVDKVISGSEYISVGDYTDIACYTTAGETGPCGHCDIVKKGDRVEVYGKRLPIYQIPMVISICGKTSYYMRMIGKPDLVIEDISWSPSKPKQGDTVTINVKTKNKGSGDAEEFYVCYYVDGSYYTRDYINSLSAGSTTTTSFTWTAESGSHSIKAYADCYDAIDESNEGNNEKSIIIEVGKKSVHNIDTGKDFATIQAAIDDSNTGHTITVDAGTYVENVEVTKSLTIKSTSGNPKDTIVQAAVSNQNYQNVFTVTADNVHIDGFTIKGASYLWCSGILIGGGHCVISNNTFEDNAIGIWTHPPSGTDNIIRNNNFASSSEKSPSTALYIESSGNKIYLNNFMIGTMGGGSYFSTLWNSPSPITYTYNGNTFTSYLGNYWDDYKDKYPGAKEIDNTGIWDTPYEMDEDKDNYPLVETSDNYIPTTAANGKPFEVIETYRTYSGYENEDVYVTIFKQVSEDDPSYQTLYLEVSSVDTDESGLLKEVIRGGQVSFSIDEDVEIDYKGIDRYYPASDRIEGYQGLPNYEHFEYMPLPYADIDTLEGFSIGSFKFLVGAVTPIGPALGVYDYTTNYCSLIEKDVVVGDYYTMYHELREGALTDGGFVGNQRDIVTVGWSAPDDPWSELWGWLTDSPSPYESVVVKVPLKLNSASEDLYIHGIVRSHETGTEAIMIEINEKITLTVQNASVEREANPTNFQPLSESFEVIETYRTYSGYENEDVYVTIFKQVSEDDPSYQTLYLEVSSVDTDESGLLKEVIRGGQVSFSIDEDVEIDYKGIDRYYPASDRIEGYQGLPNYEHFEYMPLPYADIDTLEDFSIGSFKFLVGAVTPIGPALGVYDYTTNYCSLIEKDVVVGDYYTMYHELREGALTDGGFVGNQRDIVTVGWSAPDDPWSELWGWLTDSPSPYESVVVKVPLKLNSDSEDVYIHGMVRTHESGTEAIKIEINEKIILRIPVGTKVVTCPCVADSWMMPSYPTVNNGQSGELWVLDNGVNTALGLVSFDLSAIPEDAVIHNAMIELYDHKYTKFKEDVAVYRILEPWEEMTVCYNNRPRFTSSPEGHVGPEPAGWISWDITSLTKQWVAGILPNYGLVLKASLGTDRVFYSREAKGVEQRPRLIVEYSLSIPDVTPTNILWIPTSPKIGDIVTFWYVVKNPGTINSGDATISLYIDEECKAFTKQNILAGASSVEKFEYTWTAALPEAHEIKIIVDENEEIAEINENNNEIAKSLSVADLVVTNLQTRRYRAVDPTMSAGSTITTVTINNLADSQKGIIGRLYVDETITSTRDITVEAKSSKPIDFWWNAKSNKLHKLEIKISYSEGEIILGTSYRIKVDQVSYPVPYVTCYSEALGPERVGIPIQIWTLGLGLNYYPDQNILALPLGGDGKVQINIYDESKNKIGSKTIEIHSDTAEYIDIPLDFDHSDTKFVIIEVEETHDILERLYLQSMSPITTVCKIARLYETLYYLAFSGDVPSTHFYFKTKIVGAVELSGYPESPDFKQFCEEVGTMYEWNSVKEAIEDIASIISKWQDFTKSAALGIGGTISCPANLHAYDRQGMHVGVNGMGDIEVDIPGAHYTGPDADPEAIMIFGQTENISFMVEALDEGEFDLTIEQITETGTQELIYQDVPIIEPTKAWVDVSPKNPEYLMGIDYDGDGTTDRKREPDSIETIRQTSIQLHTGWNLISLPLTPEDTNVLNVLNSVEGNWNSVWSYEGGKWKRYDLAGPDFLNTLSFMEPGKGYWLHMKSDNTLSISGSELAVKSIPLSTGWNLVGYNSLNSMPTTEAMSSLAGNWNSVWSYEGGNWKRYDLTGPSFLNTLTFMEPGKGYWLNMKSPDTWTLGA